MIYLVLDTNVWFYLANGFNTTNNKFDDGLHFKIVSTLKDLVDNGQITILTNQIIIEEWERNKQVANRLIEKHRKTMTANKGQMKNVKKYIEKDDKIKLDEIIEKCESKMEQIISKNEKHILEVEDLLLNKTEKVQIKKEIKVIAADRAINKLAPFKGDKSNSMADAVILLSSIEHIKEQSKISSWEETEEFFYVFPNSTFVTINKGDFANPKNDKEIHPELRPILESVEMKFESNIGTVINQVQADLIEIEELERIENEIDAEYWRNAFYCEVCYPDPEKMFVNNIVEFDEPVYIENEMNEEDPDQLKLFDIEAVDKNREVERFKRSEVDTVQYGVCNYCASEYIKCQYCGTANNYGEFLEGNKLECEGCGMIYQIDYHYIGSGMHETEIKIVGEENDEEE